MVESEKKNIPLGLIKCSYVSKHVRIFCVVIQSNGSKFDYYFFFRKKNANYFQKLQISINKIKKIEKKRSFVRILPCDLIYYLKNSSEQTNKTINAK